MSTHAPKRQGGVPVGEACSQLERLLESDARADILAQLSRDADGADALARLRAAMRSHRLPMSRAPASLASVVQSLDTRTKKEGFHVLESWDYRAHRFARDIVPVLMLDRCMAGGLQPRLEAALSILLDQYFLSVLGLIAVRAWDDGDPDAILDRVTALLTRFDQPDHGRHAFIEDAETLLLVAVSHYHPDEVAYDALLERVHALSDDRRLRLALVCAPVLGSHFRWGLRFMYRRDVGLLRDDNGVDYPWLLFSMRTLLDAYSRARPTDDHEAIVEGLLNGLSVDPWAFTGATPPCLHAHKAHHEAVRATLSACRENLVQEFERHRPNLREYTPLGLEVNFLCNALAAMVDTALGDAAPHPSLNALLGRPATSACGDALVPYARTLTTYARAHGGADEAALIVYDPHDAQHGISMARQVLSGASYK
jgi:hypothetical protein